VRRKWWVLGLVLVLGAGCSKEAKETSGDDGEAGAMKEVRRPFVIREAGMRFEPPMSWDLARIQLDVKSGSAASALQPGAHYRVVFDYKAEQPAHRNHPLLELMAFPTAAWAAISAQPGPPVGAPIDSVDAWVFVAAPADTNPYREDSLDADQFGAMMLTIAEVREAFSIEGDGPGEVALQRPGSKGR
jgi:hypothetical protein